MRKEEGEKEDKKEMVKPSKWPPTLHLLDLHTYPPISFLETPSIQREKKKKGREGKGREKKNTTLALQNRYENNSDVTRPLADGDG